MKNDIIEKVRVILLAVSITAALTTVLVLGYFKPESIGDPLSVGIICSCSFLALGLSIGSLSSRTPRKHEKVTFKKEDHVSPKKEITCEAESVTVDESPKMDNNADEVSDELDAFDKLNLTGAFGSVVA